MLCSNKWHEEKENRDGGVSNLVIAPYCCSCGERMDGKATLANASIFRIMAASSSEVVLRNIKDDKVVRCSVRRIDQAGFHIDIPTGRSKETNTVLITPEEAHWYELWTFGTCYSKDVPVGEYFMWENEIYRRLTFRGCNFMPDSDQPDERICMVSADGSNVSALINLNSVVYPVPEPLLEEALNSEPPV